MPLGDRLSELGDAGRHPLPQQRGHLVALEVAHPAVESAFQLGDLGCHLVPAGACRRDPIRRRGLLETAPPVVQPAGAEQRCGEERSQRFVWAGGVQVDVARMVRASARSASTTTQDAAPSAGEIAPSARNSGAVMRRGR